MNNIKTFMDFIWPFSYIGFSILNKFRKEEYGFEYTWYPYILSPDTPLNGKELDGSFDEDKRKQVLKRLNSLGSEYGLEFNNGNVTFNSNRAHKAALYAKDQGKFYDFAKEVFDCVFKFDKNIGDKGVINKIAKSLNLDVKDMNKSIDSGVYDNQIEEAHQVAKDYKVNSVPTFIVDDTRKVTDLKEYKYFKEDLIG